MISKNMNLKLAIKVPIHTTLQRSFWALDRSLDAIATNQTPLFCVTENERFIVV